MLSFAPLFVIGFALLAAAIFGAGSLCNTLLWQRLGGEDALAECGPLERASYAILLGAAAWLAVNWLFALTGTFTRATVLGAAIVFVLIAAISAMRSLRGLSGNVSPAVLFLAPIAIWAVFILWRGTVLPPDSHDALAYHLPKAFLIMQSHGYHYFATGDARMDLPANYELLLADVFVLMRSDALTEWLAMLAYIAFLVACGAVAERWWGSGAPVLATVIAVAATPVLLLHSGADKNDVMTCFFAVVALLAGARWYARGGAMPWLLLIVALAVGGGTKPHQAAILIGLAPFLVAQIIGLLRERRIGLREIAFTLAVAVPAFVLCGGASYLFNIAHERGGPLPLQLGAVRVGTATPVQYGDWANLWQFPILQLLAPFGRELDVWVPWEHAFWYWPRYEIFFSNFGQVFTVLVLLMPFAVFRYRRDGDPATRRERFAFSIAAVIALCVILPIRFPPHGFFGTFGRYVTFIIPAVIGWSLAPIARELATRTGRIGTTALLTLLLVVFGREAIDAAIHDRFSPIEYVRYCLEHPGTRQIWAASYHAASVVDQVAGPHDVIAFDAGFDTWIDPAIGPNLSRKIEFLSHGPVVIPTDAQWVVVDQAYHVHWGNPAFTDLGHFELLNTGRPTPEETRTVRALLADPAHWQLVYFDQRMNQAVFRRR